MNSAASPEMLLSELSEITRAIDELSKVFKRLGEKRDEIYETLDTLTKPVFRSTQIGGDNFFYRGYVYRGAYTRAWDLKELYCQLIDLILTEHPDRVEMVAIAMSRYGTKRNYLAREPEQLFCGKPWGWVKKHSIKLPCGWYVDTNINRERMQTLLPVAVRAAGLTWGKDVAVFWARTALSQGEAKKLGFHDSH